MYIYVSVIMVGETSSTCLSISMSFAYRSTVHTRTVPPNEQPIMASYENQQLTAHTSNNIGVADPNSRNPSKFLRPPPRVPAGIEFRCTDNR